MNRYICRNCTLPCVLLITDPLVLPRFCSVTGCDVTWRLCGERQYNIKEIQECPGCDHQCYIGLMSIYCGSRGYCVAERGRQIAWEVLT